MAAPQDRIGQQMGEYRLLRLLGQGAFGAVYQVEHVHDGSVAAIKLLQIQLTHAEEFKVFLNEARTIRLRHPHIVPLLDFGLSSEDQPFLVMEYAAGGTLRDCHARGSRLPLPTMVSYVQQVASALQYAHEHRVIHRDVKPENMLVRADGSLLLSDFGIATVAHSSHSINLQQGIGGTIPYMAPEQIQGKPRPASDQYALAVVAYEWITGQRPFQGTAVEMAMQHAMAAPPSLLELVPTLPRQVEQVVIRALAKDPKERFASIEQFAQALQAVVQPLLVPTSQNTPIAPVPPSIAPMSFMPIPVSQSSTAQLPLAGMPVETASTSERSQLHSSILDTPHPQSGTAQPASEVIEAKSGTVQPDELTTGVQPDTAAMLSPARSEMIAASASTDTFALQPISTPSRYKQITRDILALLSMALYLGLEWELAVHSSGIFLWLSAISPFFQAFLVLLVFIFLSYGTGILAAAISGRKGFDALFPVLIGCIVGCVGLSIFIH